MFRVVLLIKFLIFTRNYFLIKQIFNNFWKKNSTNVGICDANRLPLSNF